MRTRTGADGELVMEWYAPAAVTVLADGTYEVTGNPIKPPPTCPRKKTACGPPSSRASSADCRPTPSPVRKNPAESASPKGQGDDTIIRTIETNRLYGGLSERIETVRGINDAEPVACNRSVRAIHGRRLAAGKRNGSLQHAAGADDLLRIQQPIPRLPHQPSGRRLHAL